MTNEDKAKQLANKYSRPYGFGLNPDSSIECYQSALEAMDWKDEQHEQEKQQWIEKACEWWKNELTYPTMTQSEIDWYQTKIAEFRKAMKGE